MRKVSAPILLLGLVVALLVISTDVNAQSGRRGASSKPAAAPTPEPEPTPVKPKTPDKENTAVKVIVGIDRGSGFEFIPLQFYTTALYGCSDRLDQSPSVKVVGTQRDIGRGEAVSRAKKEKDTYVVWLQLRGESTSADRSTHNISELALEYMVFAPSTAKLITSGRSYQRAARVGGVIMSPPTSGRTDALYGEYMVKQAARDAAERILSSLHVPVTGKPVPGM